MLRAVYYARVSTEDEMQLSALRNQIETLEEYINKKCDWVLIGGYVDEGKSATQVKGRQEYSQLVNDMYKNKFDVVVIVRIDRGWRNDRDWAKFETDLTMSKVKLYTISNHSYYNFRDTSDWLQAGIEAKVAEMFSRQQSVKMLDAFQRGKRKGQIYGSKRMWGYDYVNGHYVINEREKVAVQYIFKRYIEGVGFRCIAKELYSMGFTSRRGHKDIFPLTTLKRIIRNIRYTGTGVTNKTYFDFFEKRQYKVPKEEWLFFKNKLPAIIDQATFDKANDILDSRRKNLDIENKSKIFGYFQGSYALSGKIRCGKCGNIYYYCKGNKKGSKPVWYCSRYKNWGIRIEKGGCDNIKLPVTEIDEIVRQAIFLLWDNRKESFARLMTVLDKALDGKEDKSQFRILTKQLESIRNQKKEMRVNLYKNLITEEEYQEDTSEIDGDIARLQSMLSGMKTSQETILEKKSRLQQIEKALIDIFKDQNSINDEAIKVLIKEIVIDNFKLQVLINGGVSCVVLHSQTEHGIQRNEEHEIPDTPTIIVRNIEYPYVAAAGQ